MPSHPCYITPHKLARFCPLLLPFLLLLSAFQIASAQTPPPTTRAVNLSTRMFVQTGDEVAIAGFIISGPPLSSKHVALRVLGQSSNPFLGLLSPMLELRGPDGLISTTNPIETMLAPGNYTAIVRGGASSDTGLAVVEVYDFDMTPRPDSKLGNISTRAFVQTGDNIVIAGFILSGDGNDRIVVRGIGPSLAEFGVPDPLADPTLELRNSSGTKIAENDDWLPDPGIPVTLHPGHPLESALAATLSAGQYTALLAGFNNTTGIGVVEVYDLH
jgi:hypothetical protein